MLKKQISPKIVTLVFSIIVICFAVAVYVSAWTEPTAVPPGVNVAAPLNISNTPQQKLGALRLGDLTVDNDAYLATIAGNVGIGTTTPAEKLEVNGNIKLSGAAATYKITNLATPTANNDVANKAYVDAQVGAGGRKQK